MKKLIATLFFCAAFSIMLALPAFADNNTANVNTNPTGTTHTYDTGTRMNTYGNTAGTTYGNTYRATAANNDNNFDWGWLGLLGLIGLAGLRGRSRDHA